MTFLQKLIDCVQQVNGIQLSAKPAKIVAGQEAEKTNEWLQAMYVAATSGKDFKSVIKKMMGGGKVEDERKPEKKKEPVKSKAVEEKAPEVEQKKEEPKRKKGLEQKKEQEVKGEPPKGKPVPEKTKVKAERDALPDLNEVDSVIHISLNQGLTLKLNKLILPTTDNSSRKQWRI